MFKIPKENIVTVCVVLGNQHTVGSPGFCAKCSESVWLSETAVNSIRNRFHNNSLGWDDMTPICPACALKFMNQKKNDEGELEQTEVILPFGNINPSKDAIEKLKVFLSHKIKQDITNGKSYNNLRPNKPYRNNRFRWILCRMQ